MKEYDSLAAAAAAAGYKIRWFGPASEDQIDKLSALLGCKLPGSFRRFLAEYGGGGLSRVSICGIANNDAQIDRIGTAFGATAECRSTFDLPSHLVVVVFKDDEVCWCLDTSKMAGDECPVVAYDVYGKKVDRKLASSFSEFMVENLSLYSTASDAKP